MFVTARGAVAALAAAAVLAGAAGCGGGGSKPTSLPSLTANTSASPAPSATGTAAELAAASTVVRQYFALKDSLAKDMDARPFEAIELPTCTCRKFITAIRDTAAAGNHYFGTTQLVSITPDADSPTQVEVLVEYNTSRGGTADTSGHILFRGPRRTGVKSVFTMRLVAQRWLIADIANINAGKTS